MEFNDTSGGNGLIQDCEFWTNLGTGAISGDSSLLTEFTTRINRSYDDVMPELLTYLKNMGWDDTNNADFPIGTMDLVTNQNAYTITQDADSLDILIITDVAILQGAGQTDYTTLKKMTLDAHQVTNYLSPNTDNTGIPKDVMIQGNTFYFDCLPNFSATNGIKVFFKRDHQRFQSTDTTKTPGLPSPFHQLLSLGASYDWLAVNKSADETLLTVVNSKIQIKKQQLRSFIMAASPTQARITPFVENDR